jgi:hypothetical protein
MSEKQKCLDIIDARLKELNDKTTPFETVDEKDFFEIQALLKIYMKIQEKV